MKFKIFTLTTFTALLFLPASFAIANPKETTVKNTYDITSKIKIDDKLVSSPRLIITENEHGKITVSDNDSKLKLDLVANELHKNTSKKTIELSFDVQYANGNTKINSKPRLIVFENQEAKVKSTESNHTIEIIALAKKA